MTDNTRIDASQNFSEIAAQLHEQFEKEGAGAGVRLDGKGLYVKGKSEFVDKHIGLPGQLKARHEKFHNAAQSLSDAIDREYQGVLVDGKTMSEYVFGDMLSDGGIHRLDEEALFNLEFKLQEGLKEAYAEALTSGDQRTVELLDDRRQYLDAVLAQTGDYAEVQRATGWREAVVGYNALRDALAESLEQATSPLVENLLDIPEFAEDVDEPLGDFYLSAADDILADIGGRRLGLNEVSVNKLMASLGEHPEHRLNDNQAAFQLADTLRDKIRMNNSVNVTGKHLSDLNDELKGMMDASAPLQKAVTENKNLLQALELLKVEGKIFDPGTAEALSERLQTNAIQIFELRDTHLENSLVRIGGDDNPAMARGINEMIGELVVGTHDLAKSLLSENDRNDPQVGFSATGAVGVKSDVLQQDFVLNSFDADEALGARLGMVTSLYRNPASQGAADTAAFGQAVDAHNENLNLVTYFYNEYLANPSMETLDDFRGMLDSALGSYYDLSANLEKIGQSKLQSAGELADGEADTLREQGMALQKLSFFVDATKQTMLGGPKENANVDLLQLEDDNVDWVRPEHSSRGVSTDSNVSGLFGWPNEDLDRGAGDINGPAGPQDEDNANTGRVRSASEESVEYVNNLVDLSLEPKKPTKRGPDDLQESDFMTGPADAGAAHAEDLPDDAVSIASVIDRDDIDNIDDDNLIEVANEMLDDLPDPNEFVARAQGGTPGGPELGKVGLIDDEATGVEQGGDVDNSPKSDESGTSSSDDVLPLGAIKV